MERNVARGSISVTLHDVYALAFHVHGVSVNRWRARVQPDANGVRQFTVATGATGDATTV